MKSSRALYLKLKRASVMFVLTLSIASVVTLLALYAVVSLRTLDSVRFVRSLPPSTLTLAFDATPEALELLLNAVLSPPQSEGADGLGSSAAPGSSWGSKSKSVPESPDLRESPDSPQADFFGDRTFGHSTFANSADLSPLAAQGVFVLDFEPAQGVTLLQKIDRLYEAYVAVLDSSLEEDEEAQNELRTDAPPFHDGPSSPIPFESDSAEDEGPGDSQALAEEEVSAEWVFDEPLKAFVEDLWNGRFLKVGSLFTLDLSFGEKVKLGLNGLHGLDEDAFKALVVRGIPGKLQQFLMQETLRMTVLVAETNPNTGIQHGLMQLGVVDLEELADNLCPEASVGWDLCTLASWDRDDVREKAASWLGLLGDSFTVQLHFYWTLRGSALVWANSEEWLLNLLGENPSHPSVSTTPAHLRAQNEGAQQSREPSLSAQWPVSQMLERSAAGGARLVLGAAIDAHRFEESLLIWLGAAREFASQGTLAMSEWINSPQGQEFFFELEDAASTLSGFADRSALVSRLRGTDMDSELWMWKPKEAQLARVAPDAVFEEVTGFLSRVARKVFNFPEPPAIALEEEILGKDLQEKAGSFSRQQQDWLVIRKSLPARLLEPLLRRQMISSGPARGSF